jgi:hypothetical protein
MGDEPDEFDDMPTATGNASLNSSNYSKFFSLQFQLKIVLGAIDRYNRALTVDEKISAFEDIYSNLVPNFDDMFLLACAKIDKEAGGMMGNTKTRNNEPDQDKIDSIMLRACQLKYREAIKLLSRKRVLPGSAEHETL